MEETYIFAVDPADKLSGWCLLMGSTYRPIRFGKSSNADMFDTVRTLPPGLHTVVVIEMVASYGMPVGREVFETCVTIGRIEQLCDSLGMDHARIYRQEEKLTICHSPKANDATIKQALVDRFASGERNYGKGTKKNPGWFYGFHADVWSAYAVGVTYLDKRSKD